MSAPIDVKALFTSCEIKFGMGAERCWAGDRSWFGPVEEARDVNALPVEQSAVARSGAHEGEAAW